MKFSFIKSGKVFFIATLAIILAAVICFFTIGFNLDIEFVGGTELSFKIDEKPDTEYIKKELKKEIGSDVATVIAVNNNEFVVKTKIVDKDTDYDALNSGIEKAVKNLYENAADFVKKEGKTTFTIAEIQEDNDPVSEIKAALAGDEYDFLTLNVVKGEENKYEVVYTMDTAVNTLRTKVEDKINELYPLPEGETGTRLVGTSTVSAEVSDSLKKSAVLATVVAIILMLVYIAIRFEGRASIAAVVCLAHDIIIMLFAYSVFQIPVSSTIIAAILTILGYSINATIVIFDRIRENNKVMGEKVSFDEKADLGVKSTLWRSLNTTITTLVTIGLVYFMGVTSIKQFALPLIVGIVAGVYSSVCLSANVWVALKKIGKKTVK